MQVEDVVKAKTVPLPAIKQSDSVLAAVKQMLALKETGLVILTPSGGLAGIITERDVMRLVSDRYNQLDKVEVWEVMSKSLLTIGAARPLDEALALMTEKHIHHLPVMHAERAIGLLSLDDIVAARLKKTEQEAQQLKEYITQQ
ncbi:MAG: CBS domain-containing protein [Spirochaetes bacterium]|nr:CBS domain-containing protein [Spirochaetota bacterium]